MRYLEKIQTLLPLGYFYLIIMGLLKESILFYQLGVNIVKYSSITDILVSPIADLTANPILLIIVVSFVLLILIIQYILVRNSHKNWARKILGRNRFKEDATKKEIQKIIFPVFAFLIAFELLSLFVGIGVGEGIKISKKIRSNTFENNYRADFNSGESKPIYLIDHNSTYCFYVEKGNKNIKIAPLASIKYLELINNIKLK